MTETLREALDFHGGIVCAVGAGGKKTTLYRLAAAWPGRYALTTTVFMVRPPRRLWDERILADRDELTNAVLAAGDARRIAYAGPSDKPGRVASVPPAQITDIHRRGGFDATFVKADGARMRGVKAPREGEPVVPPDTDLVVHISSAAVLGEHLDDESAHRLEVLRELVGLGADEPFGPAHLAALIASPRGAFAGLGGARLIPVINQVDNPERERLAREAAERALAAAPSLDRIVLASMRAAEPVVAIVRRDQALHTSE